MSEEKVMIGYKCTSCGFLMNPKHARCLQCNAQTFEEVEMGNEATIVTFTKLTAVPTGISDYMLVLGIVEFANGLRATGQITSENIDIGTKVKPVWDKVRTIGDKDIYGFKFMPI